jgi:hypothetical protein
MSLKLFLNCVNADRFNPFCHHRNNNDSWYFLDLETNDSSPILDGFIPFSSPFDNKSVKCKWLPLDYDLLPYL